MAEEFAQNDAVSRPLTVRIPEACRLTGIGRSKLYELIGSGEIEIIKVGAITLIPTESLQSFVELRRSGR
jgi:excisionase family DNA binding protein